LIQPHPAAKREVKETTKRLKPGANYEVKETAESTQDATKKRETPSAGKVKKSRSPRRAKVRNWGKEKPADYQKIEKKKETAHSTKGS